LKYDRFVARRVTDPDGAAPLGRALALAYASNPLVRWMFTEDLSRPRLEGLFTSLVEFGLRYGWVYQSADAEGAAIWFPPIGDDRFVSDEPAPNVGADTAEWSSDRRGAALEALGAARPTAPHFYLDAVGVVPLRRRHGMASDLLAPVLAECDTKGIGAYLENSDYANGSFYARHGFEQFNSVPMPVGAPPIVSMWRDPD
jgi:GNAT superfamily N-acetyltransferase